jgi:predicted amidohydrolase YtcJ
MAGLLLRGVRLVPLAPVGPDEGGEPVDILVGAGRVRAIGPDLENPGSAEEIRADGRWLIPGLWDQHVHLAQWTLTSSRLDTTGTASPEECLRRVEHRIAEQPGRHVVGWGHRSAVWERPATVTELDRIAPDVPVVLISGDGHHAWLNTTALTALSLDLRDGMVTENEWFDAYPRLSLITGGGDLSPSAYRRTLEAAAAKGVTGLVDFEFGAELDEWPDRWAAGAGLLRVRVAQYILDEAMLWKMRTGDPMPECNGLATMGPLKIISDGSLNTRTAWCCSPYVDGNGFEHPSGLPNLSEEELLALVRTAQQHHLEVSTHAIGDAAVHAALSAYEKAEARGSIEHAQLVSRDDVRRMAALGLRASVQPAHLLDDRDVSEHCWPDRGHRCFAFRWMLDAGIDVRLGSDAPVSPLDPWLAIAAAVHRSADGRPAWHPEQAMTVREALAASTDGWGTVARGHPGDLVLLDRDPLAGTGDVSGPDSAGDSAGDDAVDTAAVAARLLSMPVALTVVAGQVVHRAL